MALRATDRFLCAVDNEPRLFCVPVTGEPEDDLERSLVGRPIFPRVAATRAIAYLAQLEVSEPSWLRVVAIEEPGEGVVELLPGAVPYAPPAWSPAGDRLALIRGSADSPVQRLFVCELAAGEEEEVVRSEGIRSVTWTSGSELAYTTISEVFVLDLTTSKTEHLVHHRVAAALAKYGTDDLYVTLDQAAAGPNGRLALVFRWCQQGKPCWEAPHVIIDGTFQPVASGVRGRSPRWSADGRLAVAVEDGVRIYGDDPEGTVPVPKLHSFDWLPA